MAKPKLHWSGGSSDLRIGCERERGNRFGSIQHRSWPASVFVERATASPDHYCATCAKAARLSLAKESAPKPADVVWSKPRPISEAPKDGSMVLICVPGCDPQWTIGVFDPRQCWIDRLAPSAAAVVKPTHFLPLPPSPEVK